MHFVDIASFTSNIIEQLSQHQSLLDSARKSLEKITKSCISMLRTSRRLNDSVTWLRSPMEQLPFEKGLDHAVRLMAESRFKDWSMVTNKDAVLKVMSRDCAHAIVTDEMGRITKEANEAEELRRKRSREDALLR